MKSIVTNPGIELATLPYPLRGVLPPGKSAVLPVPANHVIRALGGLPSGFRVLDGNNADPVDTFFAGDFVEKPGVYVDVNGSDSADGSAESPLASFDAAWNLARVLGAPNIFLGAGAFPTELATLDMLRPVNVVGAEMEFIGQITAGPGTTQWQIVSGDLAEIVLPEGVSFEGLLAVVVDAASVGLIGRQRTVRAKPNSTTIELGHGFVASVNEGDIFALYSMTSKLETTVPITANLNGQTLNFLGCDIEAVDFSPVQLFDGVVNITAGRVKLNTNASWTVNAGRLALGATALTFPRFGNRFFFACGATMQDGEGELLVRIRNNGKLIIDGSLLKNGAVWNDSDSSVLFEASDGANAKLFNFGRCYTLMVAGVGDAPARYRLDDAVNSGASAAVSAVAGGVATITGLADMDEDFSPGRHLKLAGYGIFEIVTWNSATSVDIFVGAVIAAPDAGPLAWSEYPRQVSGDWVTQEGHNGAVQMENGASALLDGCEINDSPGDGILATCGSRYQAIAVTGTNTRYGQRVTESSSGLLSDTAITGTLGDALIGTTPGDYDTTLAPGNAVTDADQLSRVKAQ